MSIALRFFAFLLLISSQAQAATWYVNINATGANTGTSWANAFTDLDDATAAAIVGDQIWVAQGVYKHETFTLSTTFMLPSGVGMYGGFNGTETQLEQRNVALYTTALSADLGTPNVNSDNNYHVIQADGTSAGTRLDGFGIYFGRCPTGAFESYGGGIFAKNATLTVANCDIQNNEALQGGGVAHYGSGTMTIENCNMQYNKAWNHGGGLYAMATVYVRDCNISNNSAITTSTAGGYGGGVYFDGGNLFIDRSVISGNIAAYASGGVESHLGTLTLTNSLVAGNLADNQAALLVHDDNTYPQTVVNCTFADNYSTLTTGGVALKLSSSATLRNCIVWGNQNGAQLQTAVGTTVDHCLIQNYTGGGTGNLASDPLFLSPGPTLTAPFDAAAYDYHVQAFSPAVNNGVNSPAGWLYIADLDSMPRNFGGNVDIGAYELTYCIGNVTLTPSGVVNICPGESITLTASDNVAYAWSNAATSASIVVNAAGDFTVHALDSTGCFSTGVVTVNVYAASVNIVGDNQFCSGDSSVLTASGNGLTGFEWNNGDTTNALIAINSGNYSVTATSTDGCNATDNITVTVHPTPVPVVNYSFGTGDFSTGVFNSYQWYFNGSPIVGATSSTYHPGVNGLYSVAVTDANGCSGSSVEYAMLNVGIAEAASVNSLNVYPNPSDAGCVIAGVATGTWVVYDPLGRQVKLVVLKNGETFISTRDLPNGLYVLRFESGASIKLAVEH